MAQCEVTAFMADDELQLVGIKNHGQHTADGNEGKLIGSGGAGVDSTHLIRDDDVGNRYIELGRALFDDGIQLRVGVAAYVNACGK